MHAASLASDRVQRGHRKTVRICSYATSVVELLFSMVKRTDINPEKIATGKTKLSEVARLVYTRIL